MFVPVNELMKLNKKFSFPLPSQADFKRWERHKKDNRPVLVRYDKGLYMTCDIELWGTGTIYQNNNGHEYLIIASLEAVIGRAEDTLIVTTHIFKQYRPGIDFFHHNGEMTGNDIHIVRNFNELMLVARSELIGRERFIEVEYAY